MKQINDSLLEQFRDLVSDYIGLSIRQEDKETFRAALIWQMKRLHFVEPEAYLNFLRSDLGESKQGWKALIISITTGESYFFRDKGLFFLLQNTILPELIKKNIHRQSLRIWNAGCATGEEPYSVAILLDMLIADLKKWDISIIGTDINEESLAKAVAGIFSEWSFRMVDKDIKGKYFKKHPDGWKIHDEIKKMVKFQYGNLMEADFYSKNPDIHDMDIIICRNVFIYFKKPAVSSVFTKFTTLLNNDGYLITGHGELHGHFQMDMQQIMYPEAVIYKKKVGLNYQFPEIPRIPECSKEKKPDVKIKVKQLSQPVMPVKQVKIKSRDPQPEIAELISKGRYAEAIARATTYLQEYKDHPDILCLLANAYANSGEYEKAESCCKRAVRSNADSAEPYFLLAHIAEARGNDEKAKDLFRKALYLNPACIAAYCELGGLYEKENDLSRAKKARITAIELLMALPSRAPVKPYDITAGELLKYVEYLTGARGPSGPVEKGRI